MRLAPALALGLALLAGTAISGPVQAVSGAHCQKDDKSGNTMFSHPLRDCNGFIPIPWPKPVTGFLSTPSPAIADYFTLAGEITAAKVDALIAALGSGNIRTVYLSSDGGDIGAALDAARSIREAGVNTVTVGDCASACAFIFIAGTKRRNFQGRIGVHQWRTANGMTSDAVSQQIMLHLVYATKEAEVANDFLLAALMTEPSDMYWFEKWQLNDWNIVTPTPGKPATPPRRNQ